MPKYVTARRPCAEETTTSSSVQLTAKQASDHESMFAFARQQEALPPVESVHTEDMDPSVLDAVAWIRTRENVEEILELRKRITRKLRHVPTCM